MTHTVVEGSDSPSTLAELAAQVGWREAVERTFPDAYFKKYITDRTRGAFLSLLPIRDAEVLEIGPGFGQFTSQIASEAKYVTAFEVDSDQASFLAQRVAQEGRRNVRVLVGGADCRLPFPNESFDLVILNLVLEWCAIRLNEDHSIAHARFLSEIQRVLRPRGRLYLATKNRFALRYLLGGPDEHFDRMRFGSALPRGLAQLLHGRRPRGRLYSWGALIKMLRERGLSVENSWCVMPDVRFPAAMPCRSDVRSLAEAKSTVGMGEGRVERMISSFIPAPIARHVAPGLAVLAVKDPGES